MSRKIDIIHSRATRKYQSKEILSFAKANLKARLAICAATAGLSSILIYFLEIKVKDWLIFGLISLLPIYLTSGLALITLPFSAGPQRWTLSANGIRAMGWNHIGLYQWDGLKDWSIFQVPELPNHWVLKFYWKKWHSKDLNMTIFVPPEIDIDAVVLWFQRHAPRSTVPLDLKSE